MHHHRNHMLKFHVILPAIVLGVLLVAGVPLGGAVSAAMGAGCLAMMLMMGWMGVAAVLRFRPHNEVREEAPTTL